MSTLRDKSPFDSVSNPSQGVMLALKAAASSGDEPALIAILNSAMWELGSAEEHLEAIRLALVVGAHHAARRLANEGTLRYPLNDELKKSALVLAPPGTRVVRSQPTYGAAANFEWLRDNRLAYQGRWVALRCGALLAVANELAELTAEIDSTDGVLLTRA